MSEVQVSFVFVQDELVKALMTYLERRPLKEVKDLYAALAWSQTNQKQLADNIRSSWIAEANAQEGAVEDTKVAKIIDMPTTRSPR